MTLQITSEKSKLLRKYIEQNDFRCRCKFKINVNAIVVLSIMHIYIFYLS